MKEQSGGDDFTAEKNMKNMVNNLIKSTEKFTMHESISEKGGFRLVNNGDPIIWKVILNIFWKYNIIYNVWTLYR